MGAVPGQSSLFTFFGGLSDYAGSVAFATVIVMFCLGQWQVKFDLKYSARWMIYFDVAAWVVAYTGLVVADKLSSCGVMGFWFVADLVWNFKDGFKYTYIVYRCTRILGSTDRRPSYATFIISIALYFLYMGESYKFTGTCTESNLGHVSFNWTVVLLYGVWMLIDLIASVIMIRKLTSVVGAVASLPSRMEVYRRMVIREEARLLMATFAMCVVTVLSIVNVVKKGATAPISAITFVYVQLLLYMSSIKIENPSAASEQGKTSSGIKSTTNTEHSAKMTTQNNISSKLKTTATMV
ncbi:hypothetical protein HK104_006731 [Borealophlyctis nickersoniae]|nr:hypothetical protein HK104_006731 [Borealophlyctis nickersoniae]